MNIDEIVKVQSIKLRINHLTGNLSESECRTFIENLLEAVNYTCCCMNEAEKLLCCCDNPNGFKEMEEGRETCSKCKKPY